MITEHAIGCDGDCGDECLAAVSLRHETEVALAARRPDDPDLEVLTAASLDAMANEVAPAIYDPEHYPAEAANADAFLHLPVGTRARVKYSDAFLQSAATHETSGFAAAMLSKMRGTVKGLILTKDMEPHVQVDWDGDDGRKSLLVTYCLEVADD